VSTLGYETRAIRVRRRATAGVYIRLAILAAAMLAVFACFFAVGRVTDTGGSRVEASPELPASFQSVATSIGLSGAPPIETPPVLDAHRDVSTASRSVASHPAAAPARTSAREAVDAPSPPRYTQPISPSPAKALPSPVAVSPPSAGAPSSSSPSSSSPSGGAPSSGESSGGGGGGHSEPSSNGGGSFDSSG